MLKPAYVLDYIKKHPGITPTDLQRKLGYAVSGHLMALRRLKKIDYVKGKHGTYAVHRYYVRGKDEA